MADIGKPLKRHQVIPLHQPITAPEPQAKPLPAPYMAHVPRQERADDDGRAMFANAEMLATVATNVLRQELSWNGAADG